MDQTIYGGYRVKIENLYYKPSKYSRYVLNNISLEILPGEIVVVVGENAAGKTTLLKVISGEILNYTGSVKIGPKNITKPVNQIIDGVGIVHQFEEFDLIDHLSIAQNISIRQILGGGHKGKLFALSNKWKRSIAAKLGSHDINPHDIDMSVKYLAGGIKQMLNIEIAVNLEHEINPCKLLLLDEHTSRLDHNKREKVMQFTVGEIKRNKITTIMITHRYSEAISYADRIIIMKEGTISEEIKKENIQELTVEILAKKVEIS